jgi:hypothetical protein
MSKERTIRAIRRSVKDSCGDDCSVIDLEDGVSWYWLKGDTSSIYSRPTALVFEGFDFCAVSEDIESIPGAVDGEKTLASHLNARLVFVDSFDEPEPEEESAWVHVEDRKPKPYLSVLLIREARKYPLTGFRSTAGWSWNKGLSDLDDDIAAPTHWAPIPSWDDLPAAPEPEPEKDEVSAQKREDARNGEPSIGRLKEDGDLYWSTSGRLSIYGPFDTTREALEDWERARNSKGGDTASE